VSYRDELEHARARMDALESRVNELERENEQLREALEEAEDERLSSPRMRVYQLGWSPPRPGPIRFALIGVLLWALMVFASGLVFTMR
jgi:hypothetical protein